MVGAVRFENCNPLTETEPPDTRSPEAANWKLICPAVVVIRNFVGVEDEVVAGATDGNFNE